LKHRFDAPLHDLCVHAEHGGDFVGRLAGNGETEDRLVLWVNPLASYDAARHAATRIADARLISRELGGHLMLGQTEAIRAELAAFLAGRVPA
jgi:hypothetical protein